MPTRCRARPRAARLPRARRPRAARRRRPRSARRATDPSARRGRHARATRKRPAPRPARPRGPVHGVLLPSRRRHSGSGWSWALLRGLAGASLGQGRLTMGRNMHLSGPGEDGYRSVAAMRICTHGRTGTRRRDSGAYAGHHESTHPMSVLVWTMIALAFWHFTVLVPDRFWGGIVGALFVALAGAYAAGYLLPTPGIPTANPPGLGA